MHADAVGGSVQGAELAQPRQCSPASSRGTGRTSRLCPGEVRQAEDVKMFSTQKQHKDVALAQSPAATGCAAWCKPTRSPPPFSLFTSSKFVILVK